MVGAVLLAFQGLSDFLQDLPSYRIFLKIFLELFASSFMLFCAVVSGAPGPVGAGFCVH
jgi:hypothetical protein